jgi:D-alanine-D-alanine ligase
MRFSDVKDNYLVWVLAPYLVTDDPNLQYYYDYTQSIAEYQKVFDELGCEWKWQNVTLDTMETIIQSLRQDSHGKIPLVINLCDGDETNAVPGVTVIELLEKNKLIYTGSDTYFYRITTSKIPMKEVFDQHQVPTAPWRIVHTEQTNPQALFQEVGPELMVKPAISGGSMGLTIRNVVSTPDEFRSIMEEMEKGYRGWKLDTGGLFVESFIRGREFTTLVVGSSTSPENIHVYPAVERVFHSSLPEKEKFLSFDRLWETYDKEVPLQGHLYDYFKCSDELNERLEHISRQAFLAVKGMGYGRLDMRMDHATQNIYVLEINAQCGLSEDENYTSIGAILRLDEKSFTYLIVEIMEDALKRHHSNPT